jgi:predicted transcriptional regulator
MEAQIEREQIGKRIKALINELRLNNNSFAEKIGVTPSGVGSIVNEKYKPRHEFIEKVIEKIPNISETWLFTGEGEMFIEKDSKNNNKQQIGIRIKSLVDALKMNNNSFGKKVGISPQGVAYIIANKSKPSYEAIQKILSTFPDLSESWLLTGEGEMFVTKTPTEPSPSRHQDLDIFLSSLEKKWETQYSAMIAEKDKIIKDQRYLIDKLIHNDLKKHNLSEEILPVDAIDFLPYYRNAG